MSGIDQDIIFNLYAVDGNIFFKTVLLMVPLGNTAPPPSVLMTLVGTAREGNGGLLELLLCCLLY
jgi:hypothetical protein